MDKSSDKIFLAAPENIGGENQFYRLEELKEHGIDVLELENQFSKLEYEASNIFKDWLRQFSTSTTLLIPDVNREIVSFYIVTQLLRTPEFREQVTQFAMLSVDGYDARADSKNLHVAYLWNDDFVNKMKERISECIWIFGCNKSSVPFCASDNPIVVKSQDNKQWLQGPRIYDEGMYVVYPLSPSIIMYCKDPVKWSFTKMFENSLTPVEFTDDMVRHENSGQIGRSYRFIFSSENNFEFAREFLKNNPDFKNYDRERY